MIFRIQKFQKLIGTGVLAVVSTASAASPAIGLATSKGVIRLDSAPVGSHGTLFHGSTIESGPAGSQLKLSPDARMTLGASSRATVFRDHAVLESGNSELTGSSSYWVQARGLRIRASEAESTARVSLGASPRAVTVMAVGGPVRVANDQGLLLAWVQPGRTLRLESQNDAGGGAETSSTVTGCLQNVSGRYILVDETTGVRVELRGATVAREVGHQVRVTGVRDPSAAPAVNASQVINASTVAQLSTRCTAPNPATPAGTGGAGGAAKGAGGASGGGIAGMSTTAAVISGVAIAGAVGGITAAVKQDDERQPISR